jgi:ribosome biogenesis GTPase A
MDAAMTINWFPGHMNKARRDIRKIMSRVHLIIEVLDARIPFSSENPLVEGLRGDKPCIKVLNKSDLADPKVTEMWIRHLKKQRGIDAISVTKNQPRQIRRLIEVGKRMLPEDRSEIKGTMAMILGIPNVGKSTLINILSNRVIAKTGNVPAVTKRQQQIRIGNNFSLLDTPGFLWPKLTPKSCGYKLAVTGAIKDAVIDYIDIATYAAGYLLENYPAAVAKRYKLKELPPGGPELMQEIARKRGCMAKGGIINLHKASEILIREYRDGKLGNLSLETPAGIILEQNREGRP